MDNQALYSSFFYGSQTSRITFLKIIRQTSIFIKLKMERHANDVKILDFIDVIMKYAFLAMFK